MEVQLGKRKIQFPNIFNYRRRDLPLSHKICYITFRLTSPTSSRFGKWFKEPNQIFLTTLLEMLICNTKYIFVDRSFAIVIQKYGFQKYKIIKSHYAKGYQIPVVERKTLFDGCRKMLVHKNNYITQIAVNSGIRTYQTLETGP